MSGLGLGEAVGLGGGDSPSLFTGFISATRSAMEKLEEEDRLLEQAGKSDEVVRILRAPTRLLGEGLVVQRGSNAAVIAGQKKKQAIIMAWMNKHLEGTDIRVRNLTEALKDGVVMIKLLERLSGFRLKSFHEKPTEEFAIFENLTILKKFLFTLNVNAQFKPDSIFKGDLTHNVKMMVMIIEKFKDRTGKEVALEEAAAGQVVDITPDAGHLRVILRTREREKTELDLKKKMELAKQKDEEAKKAKQADEEAKKKAEEAAQAVTAAPTVTPVAGVPAVQPKSQIVLELPRSASNLTRALSVLRQQNEEVAKQEEITLDDLDTALLRQDILDLDTLHLEEVEIDSHVKQVAVEESVLDDLEAMESLLNGIAEDIDIDDLDL